MNRIKFPKGQQRNFLKRVLIKLNCPSLRALNQFGFEVNYSTLKNYFNEDRTLPEEFFKNLCYLAKVDEKKLSIKILDESWGQSKGGRSLKQKI